MNNQYFSEAQRCANAMQGVITLQIICSRKIAQLGLTPELKDQMDAYITQYAKERDEYLNAIARQREAGCDKPVYVTPITI